MPHLIILFQGTLETCCPLAKFQKKYKPAAFFNKAYLKLKVDTDMALSVIYSLIMNIKNKDVLPHNHIETFDFMVNNLIDSLYE